MKKKLISILFAVCMIVCMSACDMMGTNSGKTDNTLESQTNKSSSNDETATQSENSQVSSNTVESDINDINETQSTTNQTSSTNTTSQPAHTHNFAAATCTLPKKCSCGATQGSALGHKYQNGV